MHDLLPRHVFEPLVKLGSFFRDLCSKVLRMDDLDNLEGQIALTLCKLERIFSPFFFNMMVYLAIHLAWEAKVAGLVQFRWMYKIERYDVIYCLY